MALDRSPKPTRSSRVSAPAVVAAAPSAAGQPPVASPPPSWAAIAAVSSATAAIILRDGEEGEGVRSQGREKKWFYGQIGDEVKGDGELS